LATNQYFNKFNNKLEQALVDHLITEAIQIYGHDFVYLPRQLLKEDLIFGEDVLSKFDTFYDIELYIKSIDGFEGQKDLITKFGIEIKDQATFWVSRSRWDNVVGQELVRPREGDLLYYPFNGALLEIKFVTNETLHYQLGDYYVFEMVAEQFVYSDEKLATGIADIDDKEKEFAYSILLNLGAGAGTYQVDETVYQGASLATATAKADVSLVGVPPNTLKIRNIIGAFDVANGNIIGNTSTASYILTSVDDKANVNDPQDDSVKLETDADIILDFDEKDPFSENY